VRFGVPLPQFGPQAAGPEVASRIARVATAADRLGYDVLWTAEHLIFPREIRTPYPYGDRFPFPTTSPFLEVVSTLSYLAALTRRILLSSSVMVLPYRHPVLFAKELATLDVLSGGRVLVGVAAGWLAEEFDMLGVPFRERGARMDEYLDVLRILWTEERATFRGRFVQLDEAAFFPKPVQKPHPPIWIGGGRIAFDRIVRAGNGWIAAPRPIGLRFAKPRLRCISPNYGKASGSVRTISIATACRDCALCWTANVSISTTPRPTSRRRR